MIKKFITSKAHLIVLLIIVVYFLAHMAFLDVFPVFADESIYVRWSQLIIDDPLRYALFPLNDGKTPLFMWLIVPMQFLFANQLVAGRFVSVLAGGIQVLVMMALVKTLGGSKRAGVIAAFLTVTLPFWFFHQHLALIESTLVLWLSITVLAVAKIVLLTHSVETKKITSRQILTWQVIVGLSFGAALLSKLPAVLFLSALALLFLLPVGESGDIKNNWYKKTTIAISRVGIGLAIGFGMLVLLRLSQSFPQLFNRGDDFLFTTREIFFEGGWKRTTQNIPSYLMYFWHYLTPGLCVLLIGGLFMKKQQKLSHILFWSGISFILPISLMGRVVFARYLFPATLFFTLEGAFILDHLISRIENTKTSLQKIIMSTASALLVANTISSSLWFDLPVLFYPDSTPFVSSDRQQYLEEWSSGHGVRETVGLIQSEAKERRVAVATEGFFGTLPDGILLYLHRSDVNNILVEGVGVTITDLPDSFVEKALDYDVVWLVVNSHRMGMQLDKKYLYREFCRPNAAPCLQVWDVTHLVHE